MPAIDLIDHAGSRIQERRQFRVGATEGIHHAHTVELQAVLQVFAEEHRCAGRPRSGPDYGVPDLQLMRGYNAQGLTQNRACCWRRFEHLRPSFGLVNGLASEMQGAASNDSDKLQRSLRRQDAIRCREPNDLSRALALLRTWFQRAMPLLEWIITVADSGAETANLPLRMPSVFGPLADRNTVRTLELRPSF